MMPALMGAMQQAAAAGGPLFYDTFTGADGTLLTAHTPDIGGPWVAEKGSLKILSNQAAPNVTEGIASVDVGASDLTLTCDLFIDFNTALGPVFRCIDQNNLWVLSPYQGGCYLQNKIAGSFFTRGTFLISIGNHTIKIILAGTNISVYSDDVLKISYTDASMQTATKIGMRCGAGTGGRLDNLEVTA